MMRASGGQSVLISREEMHGLFSGVLNDTDRDAVTFAARIDGAIARLTGLEILRKSRDDEDSYTISPVITAIMTASVMTELQQQFEQLLNGGATQEQKRTSKLTEQFHLSRLQVINWGVFDGYHSIPFSAGGALIAGASGSGKSSLLEPISLGFLPFNRRNFNASGDNTAAGSSAGRHTVDKYVRGVWGQRSDGGTSRVMYLRGDGTAWSAVAVTYASGSSRTVAGLVTQVAHRRVPQREKVLRGRQHHLGGDDPDTGWPPRQSGLQARRRPTTLSRGIGRPACRNSRTSGVLSPTLVFLLRDALPQREWAMTLTPAAAEQVNCSGRFEWLGCAFWSGPVGSEHFRSVHLAEWIGNELETYAVGVAEIERDLAVFGQLHSCVDQLGAQVIPPLRVNADRDVVQPTQHLLVRTNVQTREIEEGKEIAIADVEEKVRRAGIVAVLDQLGQRELE